MFNYNINWPLWIARNTDTERRQPKRLAWLHSLITRIRNVHAVFVAFVFNTETQLQYNSQVIYLERALNEKFNSSLPAYSSYTPEGVSGPIGIYISQATDTIERVYIFNKSESRPKTFIYNKSESEYPTYIYNKSELHDQPDFTINVPIALGDVTTDIALQKAIRAYVNLYRYAGKRFNIINYIP